MSIVPNRLRASALLALTAALWGSPVSAQAFFEISRHVIDIDREFDDSILLQSPSFTFNVPALEEVNATGFAFGRAAEGGGGTFTFRYLRGDPLATSVLGDTVASYRSYDIDGYVAPWLKQGGATISPLMRLGLGYTRLTIPGAGTDGTDLDDALFAGLGFNLGAGAILRVADVIQVTADYTRRYLNFGSVKGFDESIEIEDGLSATTDVFAIGLALVVP
ncbi:MAG: hypothetical protein ACR2QM_03185 [Longimicrobiales bacterium]